MHDPDIEEAYLLAGRLRPQAVVVVAYLDSPDGKMEQESVQVSSALLYEAVPFDGL